MVKRTKHLVKNFPMQRSTTVYRFIGRAINNLKLIPYSYLSEKKQRTADEDLQTRARGSLAGVMKVTLFKSFDSSIHTFRQRIERYSHYLETFETVFFERCERIL